jgi:hypothetical protein
MLSLMTMSLPVFGFLNLHHGPPSISSAPNSFCASRRPSRGSAFGELHDVALVHDGHAGLVVVDRILDGLAHQALGAFARHRLDADTRGVGEADLLDAHLVLQELDQLLGLVGLGFELDAGVDVFRVFAEDHHVGLVRLLDGRRHALEVLDGAQADIQVELLAQRHVQRTDAAADRRGQRALDGHHVFTHRLQGFFGQPDVRAIDLGRLFAGEHFHPVDLALAAIGLGHRGIDHLEHHRRDVQTRAVALDEGNDRLSGTLSDMSALTVIFWPSMGHLDVLVHGPASGLDETLTILAAEFFSNGCQPPARCLRYGGVLPGNGRKKNLNPNFPRN